MLPLVLSGKKKDNTKIRPTNVHTNYHLQSFYVLLIHIRRLTEGILLKTVLFLKTVAEAIS